MADNKSLMEKQRKAVEEAKKEEITKPMVASNVMTTEAILEEFNLDDLEELDKRHKNMSSSIKGAGCITIINHESCGRRIHLANAIWRELGCPALVKVFLKDNYFFVMAGSKTGIAVKFDKKMTFENAAAGYKGKVVLYATETVKRLTEDWNLEFDSNCCFTGGMYTKCVINGMPAIKISKEELPMQTVKDGNVVEDVVESNTIDKKDNIE